MSKNEKDEEEVFLSLPEGFTTTVPGGGYRFIGSSGDLIADCLISSMSGHTGFCNCTNQCQRCGACCASGCEHRPHSGVATITVDTDGGDRRDRARRFARLIGGPPYEICQTPFCDELPLSDSKFCRRHLGVLGWTCPVCESGCAPHIDRCPCTEEPNQ